MRLLNIYTLKLEDFTGRETPRYCILSHRWGEYEVSFKEYQKALKRDAAGHKKILAFCEFVKRRQSVYVDFFTSKQQRGPVQWIWIDTCKNTRMQRFTTIIIGIDGV